MPHPALILTFHGIGAAGASAPADERPYWLTSERFRAVVATTACDPRLGFSFDDGFVSDYDIAMPVLTEHGRVADSFVLAGRIGRPGSLDPPAIRALSASGWRIGSHGFDHVDLTMLGPTGLRRETLEAKCVIEDALGEAVTLFSAPFGRINRRVVEAVLEAGFNELHTSAGGRAGRGPLLARNTVRADRSVEDLLPELLGLRSRLRSALRDAVHRQRYMP